MSAKRVPSGEEIIVWVQHGLAMLEASGVKIPRELILKPTRQHIERPLNSEQKRIRDLVDQFIATSIDLQPGLPPVQAQRIHEAFRRFADKSGIQPVSQTAVGRSLARHLRKEKLGDRIYYFDVKLRDETGGSA